MPNNIEQEIVNEWNSGEQTPINTYLKDWGVRGIAERIGNKQYPPINQWKTYNPKKSYAKTDIKIGPYKISLKSANDHIIMSAKKNEAIATFMSVADSVYKNEIPAIMDEIVDGMNGLVTGGVSPLSITKAKKAGEPIIKQAEVKHRQMIELVERAFADPTFNIYFILEVLSGNLKFGENSEAAANHMLYITHKPILHPLDNMQFIAEIARTVDVRIDFKSVKKIQGPNVGQYRFWSVLQMISKELVRDSIIYEESLMSKSISYILAILSGVKLSTSTWSDVFSFLDIEPEVTIRSK